MSELPKQYDPQAHEGAIYQQWEASGAFSPNQEALRAGKPPFVIMLPPPNITGSLHLGHALQDTIMDTLIRFHRLLGEPTLWQAGTDHAGIATQNVVEKQLRQEKLTRFDVGREKFLERVWAWRQQSGNTIIEQMKRLGSSADWQRLVFTMDPAYVAAVQETFIRYYQKGYIYRGNRLVNWCPRCASVISDLEIQHVERETTLTTLRYPLASSEGYIEVATVRPETMLGDTAVAVNPTDARYTDLVGQQVRLPLTGRLVPIIADERVDTTFGTGAVKVTPAHDPLDAELGQTHHLPVISVITEAGTMSEAAGEFAGLPLAEARDQVLQKLTAEGAVVKQEPYTHSVALCERCGTVIEPLLSRQWFVFMNELKQATITVVEQDLITFHGPRWKQHFLEWMHNVHDWTISRQLWWGQAIPVWWKPGVRGTEQENEPGAFVVSREKPAGEWEADPDVVDTWFSSAIWPLATLGWPQATTDLQVYYPTQVLTTAREILYLWVARMIFSGLELLQDPAYDKATMAQRIPFKDVVIHPTVLTKSGQRMSKSLGTGIDPLLLIDKYGADATRFGLLLQLAYDKQAIKFDEEIIKSARNFSNKLWNLARLLQTLPERTTQTVADTWIKARLQIVTDQVTRDIQNYRLGEAAHTLYDFVWNEFADWYVEIVKTEGSTVVAREVFQTILQLLHPFIPYVTEVLWQAQGGEGLLIVSQWPTVMMPEEADQSIVQLTQFQDIVRTVRSARALLQLSPSAVLQVYVGKEIQLSAPLQVLTKTELVTEVASDMKQFPLSSGGAISLGGAALTAESIKRAQQRLHTEQQAITDFLAKQAQTLAQMRGKAPAERIAAKEQEVAANQTRLAEINHSLELLTL